MPFDPTTAIPVVERPDGLLEKDNFNPATATPVDASIPQLRQDRSWKGRGYRPPLTDEDRARALVELSYREEGKELPLNLKVDWALTSQKARAVTSAAVGTLLTGGLYPVVQGLRGIADNKEDYRLMDAVTKGILYPDQTKKLTDPLMAENAPTWAKVTQSISEDILSYGALGVVKGMVENKLIVRDLARRLDKAATEFATDKVGTVANAEGVITKETANLVKKIDQVKSGYVDDVLMRMSATDTHTMTTGFQDFAKSRSLIGMLADEMNSVGVSLGMSIKPVVGQTVSFASKGKTLIGKIAEITGNRAIIDMEGRQVVAMLSQLQMPEVVPMETIGGVIQPSTTEEVWQNYVKQAKEMKVERAKSAPATPLHAEALKYKTAEEFVSAQGDIFKEKLSSLRSSAQEQGIELSAYGSIDRGVSLSKIEVPKKYRGQGKATKAIQELVSLADDNGVLLKLTPTNEFGASKERLKEFYSRFGFVENKGKNKNYQISESMYRKPKNPSQLTDIYNEAHGIGKPPAEPPAKTAVSPGPEEVPSSGKGTKQIVRESTGQVKDRGEMISERTAFNQSLKDRVKAARQAEKFTKDEIFDTQKMLTDLIDNSELSATDKSKFLRTIKNIQTQEDLTKALTEKVNKEGEVVGKSLGVRIDELVDRAERRSLAKEIKDIKTEGIAVEYQQAIENIQSQFDLKSRSADTLAKREKTRAFVERMKAEGREVNIPESTLALLEKQTLGEVDIDQLREVKASVEQLARLGKTKLKARKAVYESRKEKIKEELLGEVYDISSKKLPDVPIGDNPNKWAKRAVDLQNYYAKTRTGLTPIEGLADITGMRPMKKALDKNYGAYLSFNDNNFREWHKLTDRFQEGQLKKIGAYAAAQQDGGVDRLLNSGYSQTEIDSLELTPEEMKAYKFARDTFDKYFPDVERYAKEVYNEPVGKVDNYVSFMSDFEAMNDLEMYDRFGQRPQEAINAKTKTVEQGFRKERAQASNIKLELNIDKIFRRHLDDVAYMLTMGKDIKMYSEIVNSPEMTESLGDIGALAWKQWLDLMARKGGVDSAKKIAALDIVRRNVGVGVLGFRLSSALIQLSSFGDTMATMGAEYATRGAVNIATSKEWRNFVMDNFPEVNKAVGDDVAFRELEDSYFGKATRLGMAPLRVFDGLMRSTAASAAYEKIAAKRGVPVDLANPDKDIIEEATMLMRQSQGSSFFKDQPLAITAGYGLTDNQSLNKTLLQFQSFMLGRWDNINRQIWRLGIKEKNYAKAGMSLLWLLVFGLGGAIATRRASKKILGKEMNEEDTIAKDMIQEAISTVPLVGSLASSVEYSSNPVPIIKTFDDLMSGVGSVVSGKEDTTKLRGALKSSGAALALVGLPGATSLAQEIRNRVEEDNFDVGD